MLGRRVLTVLAAGLGLVWGAFARTVSISAQSGSSVTFRFAGVDGLDYELFMASGPADAGDEKREWEAFTKIADIAADQTSLTYEVPEALRDGRYLRFFLMQTTGIACVKELDSVISTGQQWVNTGYTPNNRTVVDFRFGKLSYSNQTAFFGQGWAGSCYLLNQQSNKFMFHGGGGLGNDVPTPGVDYRCVIDDDGRLYFSYGNITNTYSVSRNVNSGALAIFGCNNGSHLAAFSFYRMKIDRRDNGVFQRDFIPALNVEGEAGLYDQVNNAFYVSETEVPLLAGEELPQDRFGRVVDTTPSFRFHRSVTITEMTRDVITLGFGNPRADACKLFVAYGNTDGGDDKIIWDTFTEVATVAGNATSYTYPVPAALKTAGTYFRFFLVQTDNLPYSAEVASLSSNGGQCVRVGYAPGPDTTVEFHCGNVSYVNATAFFGQAWQGNAYLFNQQSNKFYFHGSGIAMDPVAAGTDYGCYVRSDESLVLQAGDGSSGYVISRNACPFIDLTVFNCYSVTRGSSFRFDSMRVKDDGLLVRDLVPVVANGKGALFDRMTGICWFNATGSDFSKGTTIGRQGWPLSSTASLVVAADGSFADPYVPAFVKLTEDTDWTDCQERLANGVTVDLNGYTLHLSAPETRSPASPIVIAGSGTFHLTVPKGQTWNADTLQYDGNITILKDGEGSYLISRKIAAVSAITIAEGEVKMGNNAVLAGGTHITVKDGATCDVAGRGDNVAFFTIEGTGPDGKGALRNTGGDISNSTAQMAGFELTGDATVYGTGHLGLINSSYNPTTFELNGHTLTLDLTAGRGFWFCNTTGTSGGTVYTKSGIPYFHRTTVNIPNVDFIIDGQNSIFRMPTGTMANPTTVKSVTVMNGGLFEEGYQATHMENLTILDGGAVGLSTYVRWIYVKNEVVVSNETTDVTIYPPVTGDGTYPKLIKKGAGTLTLANNHTDQRFDRGVEIFGGTVVMSSTASTLNYHVAISSQPVPVTIHAGGTLDMRQCTQPFALSSLTIEEGGTLLHTAANTISFRSANTFTEPKPFAFAGTVNFTQPPTFVLDDLFAGPDAPAAGASVTLLEAGAITANNGVTFKVMGCPYAYDLDILPASVTLKTSAGGTAPTPITIWTVGGNYVYGNATTGDNFRFPLARLLTQEGWNVKMTGWRTASGNGLQAGSVAWGHHCGIQDLALKTSPARAGLLEGLDSYALAAGDPDFTILVCGELDVADGISNGEVLARLKSAVTRIKAALPMTTVLLATIPGGSVELNNQIAAWCDTEADVESVNLANVLTTAITAAECDAAAALLKAKLMTLATAAGKTNPSTWTRPAVTLGAENNVPEAYRAGFTRVRTIEPTPTQGFAQNIDAIPYSYAPPMRSTDIAKVAYYIELVRKDTGAFQALWVDMDAPGSTWADVTLPVTLAQQKQKSVTKLHVWSNFGGVTMVPPTDNTVEGYIEFNPINYGGAVMNIPDAITEPWEGNMYGFNDTFNTSGTSGHGCFQLMRKFSDGGAFPAGEILFAYNRWGSTGANTRAIGMGTLADFGKLGVSGDKSLDWTFTYGAEGSDAANISSLAYSTIKIDFWVQYSGGTPSRADLADATWSGATDGAFGTVGNWTTGSGAPTTLANSNILLPARTSQSFSYPGYDPIALSTTVFMVDGTATFPDVGGIYLAGLDMGSTGKLVYDPTTFTFRLVAPPIFASGAKIALTPNYATHTKGRFLLMTWDNGSLDLDAAALNALFDTGSANGADVKVWAENLETGGRLWLDLNDSAAKPRVNILCVGDSITQGYDASYGNWRTGLMKKLAADGYAPVGKGHLAIDSHDICGAAMPEEWIHHAGISGQRLVTLNGGGTIDCIEATLDQAGDVDFVLVMIGTNDINSNGSTAATLFPVWEELVWKVLNQKPHAVFIAGSVVDIAYDAAKDEQVVAFNTQMRNAINDGLFPAKRAYYADLYTPCYRYGSNGAFIPGSFQSETDLHPDWPGEDKLAAAYCAVIEAAIADADADWTTGAAELNVPTGTGAENNVPAAFLSGLTRARTLDLAAYSGQVLTTLGVVPYVKNDAAPTENLSRVGYYIELKRKNDAQSDFHGLVRWLWVSMDAFGGKTIEDVGVPLTIYNQALVRRLRVASNMPGIASTAADATSETGWVEFWPSSYTNGDCGNSDAPANTYGYDWDDTRSDNMSGYGAMQVHRFTPGARNPAQTLFAFNRWSNSGSWEIGLGNFSHVRLGSIDWTFSGDPGKNMTETMSADAYEIAKLEIWTASMENDPDAPTAALVYIDSVIGEGATSATVTGSLVEFGIGAENATVTLEWSTDPAFATIAGSQSLGTISETGPLTATATGLTAGSTWYFRFTSVNSTGKTAASETSDPLTLTAGYWRPQTTADIWTSIAWLKDNAGSPVAFNPLWTAVFDGLEPTKTTTVQIPEAVEAKMVRVEGGTDYTFDGDGTIASERLVKAGSGTLTLESRVLANTTDIEIRGGVVRLGDNAIVGAAGTSGGSIIVKDGGQFDFNHIDTESGNNRPRALITSGKTFVIEGEGPDGSGALTSTADNTYWGSPISEVVLTGDATIGGKSRIDIRGSSKNSITGPDDATLTIKNSAINRTRGLNVHGPISVGKMVITEEGCYTPEGGAFTLTIPNGIELRGALSMWAATGAWNVGGLVAVGDKAYIGNDSGTSYVRTDVTVQEGATLSLGGGGTTRYANAVTNRGTIVTTSNGHYIDAELVNEGNPLMQLNGDIHNYATTVTGDSRAEIKSGYYWTSGITDWGESALDVALSGGGTFVFGQNNDGYAYPKFGKNKLSVTVADGHTGTFFLHSHHSGTSDGVTITGPLNNFFAQGPNNGSAVIDSYNSNYVFTAKNLIIGTNNGRGEHRFAGPETAIAAETLQVSNQGNKNYYGMMLVDGGTLSIGSGGITAAWRQPARPLFVMADGTLRANTDFALTQPGMTATFGTPIKGGKVTFDLNGKTVKWGTGLTGGSDVTLTGNGTFTPDRPGIQGIPTGKWTVDTTANVDLSNAAGFAGGLALTENAIATLDIAGESLVEMLFWTWHDNAWNIMKPYFEAGLPITPHLATSLTYFNRPPSQIRDLKHGNGTGINYIGEFYVSAEQAGKWYFAHRAQTHLGIQIDNTELSRTGPNNGTISNITLTEGWHAFMISAYTGGDNPVIGPMTDSGDDAKENSVWFKVGGDTNGTWPADYTPFDTTTVPMRMRSAATARTSVRWRKYTHPESNLAIYDTIDESLYSAFDTITNSLQIMHTKFSNGANAPLGGACTRFSGYFYVSAADQGVWLFQGNFDDQIALDVDGRRLFRVSANCATASGQIALQEGWHAFDIRLGDNSSGSSGGTGGGLTDADGNVCTLEFSVNGGAYHAFDERYLRIAASAGDAQKREAPGLGGETELAAGSILINAPRDGGYCPIYGTLKGAGTLSGPFRFTGTRNCWEVSGDTTEGLIENTVAFDNPDPQTLAGLKRFKAVFNRQPTRSAYILSAPLGLTEEAAAQVEVTVQDITGKDYSEDFSLIVTSGKLMLKNARPGGMYMILK